MPGDPTSSQESGASARRAEPTPRRRAAALGLHRAERRFFLLVGDLLAINAALLVSLQVRDAARLGLAENSSFGLELLWQRPMWFLVLSALWMLVALAFDAYRLRTAGRLVSSYTAALKSAVVALLLYAAVPYVTPALPAARRYWLVLFVATFAMLLLSRGLYVLALGSAVFGRPTLIVGAGWAGQTIAQVLLLNDGGTYRIVGFVDDDEELRGRRILPRKAEGVAQVAPIDKQAFTVLGGRAELKELIDRLHVRTLVLAITDEIEPDLYRILTDCLGLGVEIVPMGQLYERLTGRVPVEHVGGSWHLAMPLEHPGTRTLPPLVKRLFDMVSATVGALLLTPFVPLIAAAIKVESPGPVFYSQARIGKGGRLFRVFKFRSMRSDAEEGRAVWSQQGDPRVTRVGRFLRATHIDEFPQFLNVLRGEMSAVGPRPERPEFLEGLVAEIPFYTVRHAVKPGMAGWALVNCGYGSSTADALRKLQYDLYYVKHQSLLLDIVIILKTVLHSVGLQGR